MTNRVQSLRSSVAGNRPTGRQPGELYVNWPDGQLGVINASSTAQDLIAVRFFSTGASYNIGDHVIQNGYLYRAIVGIIPGAFNIAQWALAGGGGSVTVGDTPPSNPQSGQLWFDSVGGNLFVWYNDGTSSQWVVTVNGGPPASTSLPLMDGTAAVGTSTAWAHGDHVHPSDTSRLAVVGVTDGSNAAAGQIGEYITNSNSDGAVATGTTTSLCSITLTPGDWDVWGVVEYLPSANQLMAATSSISPGSSVTVGGYATWSGGGTVLFANYSQTISIMRVSITLGGSYALQANATFSSGTMNVAGMIAARRMR